MTTVKDALRKARADGQALHAKIAVATGKKHADIRADLEAAAQDAKQLGDSLKKLGEGQRADAGQHLKNAAERFEQAAVDAKSLKTASETQLHAANKSMLADTRAALSHLSRAMASTRSTLSKN